MAFARVMAYYQMEYEAVLKLPIRVFWFLNQTINRLEAESNLRKLELLVSSQSAEGYENLRQSLIAQMGTLMEISRPPPKLDKRGLDLLRSMSGVK